MDLHAYVAGEIATDCADGLISRREALRRLSLIGLGTVSAGALLTACGGGNDADAKRPGTSLPGLLRLQPRGCHVTTTSPTVGSDSLKLTSMSTFHRPM